MLGGFSQGAVMALRAGAGRRAADPRRRPRPQRLRAHGRGLDARRRSGPGLPAFVTHGRRDPVIPVEFGRATRDLLEPSPVDLTYVETDAAHHVDPRTLAELPAWLEQKVVLAAPQD